MKPTLALKEFSKLGNMSIYYINYIDIYLLYIEIILFGHKKK